MTSPSVNILHMDRLPLPVTISFIRSNVQVGERVRIGNKSFSKVICVGRVQSYRCVRSISALEYILADPSDEGVAKEIVALNRFESFDMLETMEQFSKGTLVLVPGKLIRFKGAVAIQAYSMRELICPEEYDCLRMEAYLALQFHTKNPSGQTPLRRPQLSRFPGSSRSSSSSTTPTVAGKRSASPGSFSTPKRTLVSDNTTAVTSRPAVSNGHEEALKVKGVGISALKEAGSQDSFEDTVFIRST